MLTLDLGIDERYKPVIQHYIKFFGEKKRTQAFYDLELETFNRNTIEIALMSVLCKCKTPSYEEVLRTVLTDAGFEDKGARKGGKVAWAIIRIWQSLRNMTFWMRSGDRHRMCSDMQMRILPLKNSR